MVYEQSFTPTALRPAVANSPIRTRTAEGRSLLLTGGAACSALDPLGVLAVVDSAGTRDLFEGGER